MWYFFLFFSILCIHWPSIPTNCISLMLLKFTPVSLTDVTPSLQLSPIFPQTIGVESEVIALSASLSQCPHWPLQLYLPLSGPCACCTTLSLSSSFSTQGLLVSLKLVVPRAWHILWSPGSPNGRSLYRKVFYPFTALECTWTSGCNLQTLI